MSGEPLPVTAVRVALGLEDERLELEDGTTVTGPAGQRWRVTTPAFAGLVGPGDPTVLIVAPLGSDDPDAPVWVGAIPGRGLKRLRERENLAALLEANPALPAETVARLVAINLGPRGAERVLIEEAEVESLLEERAADVPPVERGFEEFAHPEGGRTIRFLGATLRRSPADGLFRVSVARWEVHLGGGRLSFDRREILSDALLKRYGG